MNVYFFTNITANRWKINSIDSFILPNQKCGFCFDIVSSHSFLTNCETCYFSSVSYFVLVVLTLLYRKICSAAITNGSTVEMTSVNRNSEHCELFAPNYIVICCIKLY